MADSSLNPAAPTIHNEQQYLRKCKLLVYQTNIDDGSENALDLSNLRIKFAIKRSDTMTPNMADIRVYNVARETALSIFINLNPSTSQPNRGGVILEAGYEGNSAVIFRGNIKQVILGRENATDTFVDIIAGDGERAYNFSIVNQTLAPGSTQLDQVNAAQTSMANKGVSAGHYGVFSEEQLPRGKVLYGNSKLYLRQIANDQNKTWSIQNEQLTFIPLQSYLPGERVILNSRTGLIGTPNQTNEGVNMKCLLNPQIKIGGQVDINEAEVQDFKINLSVPNSAANIPAPFSQDGVYYVLCAEHNGDNRGVEWYTNLVCLLISPATNPVNSVQVGYGG